MKLLKLKLWMILTCALIISSSLSIVAQNYPLVWAEEFDYTGLPDSTKWKYDVGGHGWGNNELQYYTENRPENARVENGRLIIEARQESYEGANYTSARLVSVDDASWLYGRVEVRAKVPVGRGTWAAIWMLPTDWTYGGWPASGEIDIMEHVGYDPNHIHGSTHSQDFNFQSGGNPTGSIYTNDVANNWHVYAMEWWPDRIDVYLDGQLYFTSTNPGTGWTAWPFDKRFHMILNIAVGGNWGGAQGIDPYIWPERMEVDYVRVYDFELGENDQTPPSVPTDLTATAYPYAIDLAWNHSTDNYTVDGYIVKQNGVVVDTVSGNQYFATNLQNLTSYQYEVQAYDLAGNLSGYSQVFSQSTSELSVVQVPEFIEAEDYNNWEGVQLETNSDVDAGQNVGWFDPGDWMEYRIDPVYSGTYSMDLRVASASDTTLNITLLDANDQVITSIDFSGTTGWQTWATVSTSTFDLIAGQQNIRITTTTGGVNLNWFEIKGLVTIPGLLEAEDYSEMQGIQLEATSDGGGGQNVGWIDAGDFLKYQVNALESEEYLAVFRVASQYGGGSFDFKVDGQTMQNVSVPSTGGWQNWTDVTIPVSVTQGTHDLEVAVTSGGFNLNWLYFDINSTPNFTQLIQAEDHNAMYGVSTENTSDEGGGLNVGWFDTDDWMEYWVDLPESGHYELEFRIATPQNNKELILSQYQQDLSVVSIPNTGGWQSWQTVTTTVNLNAGNQPFALFSSAGSFNVNWWRITYVGSSARTIQDEASEKSNVEMRVYPNPVADLLYLSRSEKDITVLDMKGAVLQVDMKYQGDRTVINTSALKPGIYFVAVRNERGIQNFKVIKR